MGEPQGVLGVSIRVRPTWPRIVIGCLLFAPLAWFLLVLTLNLAFVARHPDRASELFGAMGDWLLPLALAWFGQRFFREHQTVTLENRVLVVRRSSWVGPALTSKIGMDRVVGRHFEVLRWRRDDNDPNYRPALNPRIVVRGDRGAPLAAAGQTLTLDEAERACEIGNRLLERPAPSPLGSDDFPG